LSVLGRFDVLPLYGQIDIRDPAAADYPQWETGEEKAVATAHCIAVATRGDLDGRVAVEVRHEPIEEPDHATIAFDGSLLLTGEGLVVGNYLGGEEHWLPLPPGSHHVTVYTRPLEGRAAEVIVAIDAKPSP
jgi:hypothetical protein